VQEGEDEEGGLGGAVSKTTERKKPTGDPSIPPRKKKRTDAGIKNVWRR